MTTVLDIITDAHIAIGAADPSNPLSNSAAAYGLRVLNRMLSSWNNEGLMVYTVNRMVFPITAGVQIWTLGTGGTLNMPRPARLHMASILIPGTYPTEIPLQIFTDEEWQAVAVKNPSGGYPTGLWMTGDVPLSSVYLWPVPAFTCSLVLYTWGQTQAFTSLQAAVVFPDGYEEAIVNGLAMLLAPSFGITPNPIVPLTAGAAKMRIASLNWDPISLSVDSALMGSGSDIAMRSFGKVVDP